MAENVPVVVVYPLPDRNPVDKALEWIRFVKEANRNSIHDEGGLEALEIYFGLTGRFIRYTASGFSKRNTAQGRTNSGMRRVKYTLDIMNWAQDESRYSWTASVTGITNAEE